VRGLASEVTTETLRDMFGRFGDLRDVYNLAERKGIAFIEFVCRGAGGAWTGRPRATQPIRYEWDI